MPLPTIKSFFSGDFIFVKFSVPFSCALQHVEWSPGTVTVAGQHYGSQSGYDLGQ
jgi:hypothetical protein